MPKICAKKIRPADTNLRALHFIVYEPLLVPRYILQGICKRSVISFLSVVGVSPGMPVQDITFRSAILRNDYPVMSCDLTVERDIVMVDLKNRIRQLP